MSNPNSDSDERVRQIRERRHAMEQFGDLVVSNTPGSHRSFVIVAGTVGLEANCGVDGERNRTKAEFFANAPTDIDYLLSLLDSQAVARPVGWISCGLRHGHDRIVDIMFESADCAKAFIDGVEPVVGPIVAATRMRDRCVQEIKDRLYSPTLKYANKGIEAAIIDWTHRLIIVLESLTLEGEQEK